MKIFFIMYYTLLENIRDRRSLFQMLVFPIMLMFVLGSALSGAFTPSQFGSTSVAYLSLDSGIGTESFEGFLARDEIKNMLTIKRVATIEEGIDLIEAREVVALIYIEEGYTAKLLKNKKAEIKVINSSFSNYRRVMINSIIEGYTDSANGVMAAGLLGGEYTEFRQSSSINNVPISTAGKLPTAIDYYSVTMLAMVLMYGAGYSIHGIGQEKFDSVGVRIKAAPISPYEIYIGKTLGTVGILFLQAVILVLFTGYVYKVNWGGIGPILMICFSLCTLSTALGVMVSIISPSKRTAQSIMQILVPIFTFVSGGYVKLSETSLIISKLKYISPNYLAQTAIFNQMFGGSQSELQLHLMGMWLMITVCFAAAITVGRRQTQ